MHECLLGTFMCNNGMLYTFCCMIVRELLYNFSWHILCKFDFFLHYDTTLICLCRHKTFSKFDNKMFHSSIKHESRITAERQKQYIYITHAHTHTLSLSHSCPEHRSGVFLPSLYCCCLCSNNRSSKVYTMASQTEG